MSGHYYNIFRKLIANEVIFRQGDIGNYIVSTCYDAVIILSSLPPGPHQIVSKRSFFPSLNAVVSTAQD